MVVAQSAVSSALSCGRASLLRAFSAALAVGAAIMVALVSAGSLEERHIPDWKDPSGQVVDGVATSPGVYPVAQSVGFVGLVGVHASARAGPAANGTIMSGTSTQPSPQQSSPLRPHGAPPPARMVAPHFCFCAV